MRPYLPRSAQSPATDVQLHGRRGWRNVRLIHSRLAFARPAPGQIIRHIESPSKTVKTDDPQVEPSLRRGMEWLAGAMAMKKPQQPSARAHPASAPAMEIEALPSDVWRTSRARLAPNAERTASSRCRVAPRAINRLATFAHAISSTAKTAPSRTHALSVARSASAAHGGSEP